MATYTFPNEGGLKLNKDHTTMTTAADCPAGSYGDFTEDVELALVAQYTTANYSVWANQIGTPIEGVLIDGSPVSPTAFKLCFFNGSGADVPANTSMDISYSTLGV